MEYRTLDLTLTSATGLKKSRFFRHNNVYAVATVIGDVVKPQKYKTTTDRYADSNPMWNFPMNFTVVDTAGRENRQILAVNIKAAGFLGEKNLGFANIPIKELLEGVTNEGKAMQIVSYRLENGLGKNRGVLNLTYKIGEKFYGKTVELPPVTAKPPAPRTFVGSSSKYKASQNSSSSMGFGTALLGVFLAGDVASHATPIHHHSGGGGGCGGGTTGCGGGAGCGGGGCGGGGGS